MGKKRVFIYQAVYKIISCSPPPIVTVKVPVACTNPYMTAYKTRLENEEINVHISTSIFLTLFTSVVHVEVIVLCRGQRSVRRARPTRPPLSPSSHNFLHPLLQAYRYSPYHSSATYFLLRVPPRTTGCMESTLCLLLILFCSIKREGILASDSNGNGLANNLE